MDLADSHDASPLCNACVAARPDMVERLCRAGANVNQGCLNHRTPLILAVQEGDQEIVEILLKQAALDINASDRHGATALWLAANLGHTDLIKLLLSNKADVDKTSHNGSSPFLEAVKAGHEDIVILLAQAGCDINKANLDLGHTPVYTAVRQSQLVFGDERLSSSLLDLLLSLNCDLHVQDTLGWTPLHQAAFSGQTDVLEKLVSACTDLPRLLAMQTHFGDTCLHSSIYSQNVDIVKRLLELGSEVNAANQNNKTALFIAVENRAKVEILQQLISSGSDVETVEKERQQSLLFRAIELPYNTAVKLIIKAGADVNRRNRDGDTALWVACDGSNAEAVEILLDHPATDVNAGRAHIPLHAAILNCSNRVVLRLVRAGASVNKLSDICSSSLFFAATSNREDVARLLIQYGADASTFYRVPLPQKCCRLYRDAHPHFELEPLQSALNHNSFSMIKILLQGATIMPYPVLRTLYDLLFRTPYMRESGFTPRLVQQYQAFFSLILSKPRPLKQSCRGAIRLVLGERPSLKTDLLPIPDQLKDYILHKDDLLSNFDEETLDNDFNPGRI